MLAFHPNLFVRVEQLEGPRSPQPRPLESGFSVTCMYRVLGVYSPSETAEAYFILANDTDQMWFISQRHLRFACLLDSPSQRLPLPLEMQLR
ncbi:hypothetical protein V3W47_10635 [Deinococcus sp. YIM 134068]|uniref:hypothetical protein n=1 Tax=Deinococcus lichenicola TaxID=3118910 RepID=UPI002F95465C